MISFPSSSLRHPLFPPTTVTPEPSSSPSLVHDDEHTTTNRKRCVRFSKEEIYTSSSSTPSVSFSASSLSSSVSSVRPCKRSRTTTDASPLSSPMTSIDSSMDYESLMALKSELWISNDESRRIRREARTQAQHLRKMDEFMAHQGHSHLSFSETYANVYYVMCSSNNNNNTYSTKTHPDISPEILTFMSLGEGRGLEDQTSPRIAIERRLRRQQTIKMVCQAHHRWGRTDVDGASKVRLVAETLSAPSVHFASALGLVDASAAILACQQQDETSILPNFTAAVATTTDVDSEEELDELEQQNHGCSTYGGPSLSHHHRLSTSVGFPTMTTALAS